MALGLTCKLNGDIANPMSISRSCFDDGNCEEIKKIMANKNCCA